MKLRFYRFIIPLLILVLLIEVSIVVIDAPVGSKAIAAVLSLMLSLTTGLGFYKYLIEPHWIALELRRKFATALSLACYELQHQLNEITLQVSQNKNPDFIDALLKLPSFDSKGKGIDWFTKDGYYTSITAYKIASVSAWLSIYRQSLLLSAVTESREFLSDLYRRADGVAREFSDESLFWRDYFYAIGDKLIESGMAVPHPISFAEYCERSWRDESFRMFFDQLHMYLWSVAKEQANLQTISDALEKLREALAARDLVEGLVLKPLATSFPTQNLHHSFIPKE